LKDPQSGSASKLKPSASKERDAQRGGTIEPRSLKAPGQKPDPAAGGSTLMVDHHERNR